MKKILLTLFCCALFGVSSASAIDAFGGLFGNLATARTIGMGQGSLSGNVGIADVTSVFGVFTYGASEDVDFRIKAGLADGNGGDTEFTIGTDLKYQLWRVNIDPQGRNQSKNPFDLALGGMFEYIDHLWQLGGFATGSYPVALSNGMTLSPYARFNVRVERFSYAGYSDSGIKFGLNGGAALKFTQTITAYGEFQLDGNDGVFLGLDFLVL